MIRNLLLSAATSPNINERNQCQQILKNQFTLKPQLVTNELFNLICSSDRTDHILGYSFFKKMIRESQRQKLIDFNLQMQKAFFFWYQKNQNRNSLEEVFTFQRENAIHLNALYLSLNTSGRYRQSFIDIIPFKICELFSKGDKRQLYFYLTYYGQVLKQLDRYRVGNINSKRLAMGSVMLLKVTTRLNPQNSIEASLWVEFTINFSKFNSWIPDKNFLINCLIMYQIEKSSLMTLLQFLSTNFKIVWALEDYCKILQGLEKIMSDCQRHVSSYECKEVQTILKCLRSFLYNFFVCDKKPQNAGQALIVEYIHSYDQFEKTSNFIIAMIEYFSMNNQKQSMGNLSQMIVEYSTQILRLYLNYHNQIQIQKYAKRFMEQFQKNPQYEKIFIFFSALPKFVLEMFDYEQGVMQILNGSIQLSEKFQLVYVNFLTHYIIVSDYLNIEIVNKLGSFFLNLIKSRSQQISSVDYLQGSEYDIPQYLSKIIERVSLSIYALSRLSKYKDFVDSNPEYFSVITGKIFEMIIKSSNDINMLIDSITELIRRQNPQWNEYICRTSLEYLLTIRESNKQTKRFILYQVEIQLYRIIKKTLSLSGQFDKIQSFFIQSNFMNNIQLSQWAELRLLVSACDLNQKSQAVKEEILSLIEEALIQFNKISYQGKFKPIQTLLIDFLDSLVSNLLFEEIYRVLAETSQLSPQTIVQNNLFDKLEISNEEYAIVSEGSSKQLHLNCVKILLELCLHEKYLQPIFLVISKLNSRYLLCVWEAVEILYPGKINQSLIPSNVKERLEKIRTGNILDLFEKMDLNEETKMKMKETPSWYQLYRNILREDSVVIDIIHQKVKEH